MINRGEESKSNLLAFITVILAFTILPEFFFHELFKENKGNKRIKESVCVCVGVYSYIHTHIYMNSREGFQLL